MRFFEPEVARVFISPLPEEVVIGTPNFVTCRCNRAKKYKYKYKYKGSTSIRVSLGVMEATPHQSLRLGLRSPEWNRNN